LWEIFNLAFEKTPDLVPHLRFIISGKLTEHENPEQAIEGWGTRSKRDQLQKLVVFKKYVNHEIVSDPKAELSAELQNLGRDEDADTTIARWLGYLLQLGSGVSTESINTFIWTELLHDKSLEAFQATISRLLSLSRYRLCAIRDTVGEHITLPIAKLSDLQKSVLEKRIVLLFGPSGSGKSALCKVGIQQQFKQNFDCLFLHASDIESFTELPDVTANRGLRRLDELFIARIFRKPVLLVIDDLSDVDNQQFESVLNLLQNTLTSDTCSDVHFILTAHLETRQRINEKISARLRNNFLYADIELPQLPIDEFNLAEGFPATIIDLINRHHEFGPALNLKLIDWLIRSIQSDDTDISIFRSDLDLLSWFWNSHVQNGQDFSDAGRALIKISGELANKFTPDLPLYFDTTIENEVLQMLRRRDCLRIADERLAVTHRFIGDCARFHDLRANRRELETEHLVERLRNPLWVQPIRWFSLQLAVDSEKNETWQELMCEALKGEHLQLLDLLLDGAILSKQPASVLKGCSDESLPFVIERLIKRLLTIATDPYPFQVSQSQSQSLRTRIFIQEQTTGIPNADLWEPVWRWLLSQRPEIVIKNSCIVFRAAEAWLNWSIYAERFPLRSKVAEFILDLAHIGLLPETTLAWKERITLGEFEKNAFECIVFALKIIPEYSTWLLRVLAGRETISANKLEPIREATDDLTRVLYGGDGVLQPAHPQGPLTKVNDKFRKFMLGQNGLFLDFIIRINPCLGVELFLALTIQPPHYLYPIQRRSDYLRDDDLGTAGSDNIDVCTFKFSPLLSLLKINEEVAINIVAILCKIATCQNCEIDKYFDKNRTELDKNSEIEKISSSLKTDTHELTLVIGKNRKQFQGGRKTLYWHRNNSAPKILACLLMTLEGWLYSRPTRLQLEHSISLIFKRGNTVAILGVLVTIAKCDSSLLTGPLLPLISPQLLIWADFEQIDYGQDFGFDSSSAWMNLQEEEQQELYEFNQLSYRELDFQKLILHLWVNRLIPLEFQSQILEDWDNYQLTLVPEISRSKALRIRASFEQNNWQEEKDSEGNQRYRFVGNLPDDPEADAETESALWNLQHIKITVKCRQILDGKREKTPELHNDCATLLMNELHLNKFKDKLEHQAFINIIWAMIAIVLEPPLDDLDKDLESELNNCSKVFSNFPIHLGYLERCQSYDLDANSFMIHVAPKLLRRIQSDSFVHESVFCCLIGVRNCNTSAFLRAWIREYGFDHPLTQQIINVVPRIARLISLSNAVVEVQLNKEATGTEGSYIVPRPEEINNEIGRQENPHAGAWISLQNDFIENKLPLSSIVDAFKWIPEMLIQPIQNSPIWLRERFINQYFDWEFLVAALTPILELNVENEKSEEFVTSLCEQALIALLYGRESVYEEYETNQEGNRYGHFDTHLYPAQVQLLKMIILSNRSNILLRINQIISALSKSGLADLILLNNVINNLIIFCIENSKIEINNGSIIGQIALTIGDCLFEFRNPTKSNLRILGEISDVWKNLIELLSRESKTSDTSDCADQSLVQFIDRYKEVLLTHWFLRRELCSLAKAKCYKHSRRIIFKELIQSQHLLPSDRNDESEVLVQVLAELWDSDRTWIITKQSRLLDLKTLLGHLQGIDATGAGILANQVANF
jgi:ATPase family associated with various cellular activities (AAA)